MVIRKADIIFVTSNKGKVELANERLNRYGINITQQTASVQEIQSLDVEEVALHKARQLEGIIKKPFFVEDSGLYIDKLNGFPGALLKPVMDTIKDDHLLKMLSGEENRSACVKSVMAYYDPVSKTEKLFIGIYKGRIAEEERGNDTRGWKVARIFIPDNFEKTLAEMNDDDWDRALEESRKDDHFYKFGEWFSKNNHAMI